MMHVYLQDILEHGPYMIFSDLFMENLIGKGYIRPDDWIGDRIREGLGYNTIFPESLCA